LAAEAAVDTKDVVSVKGGQSAGRTRRGGGLVETFEIEGFEGLR